MRALAGRARPDRLWIEEPGYAWVTNELCYFRGGTVLARKIAKR
jgi:hypothetical protein